MLCHLAVADKGSLGYPPPPHSPAGPVCWESEHGGICAQPEIPPCQGWPDGAALSLGCKGRLGSALPLAVPCIWAIATAPRDLLLLQGFCWEYCSGPLQSPSRGRCLIRHSWHTGRALWGPCLPATGRSFPTPLGRLNTDLTGQVKQGLQPSAIPCESTLNLSRTGRLVTRHVFHL